MQPHYTRRYRTLTLAWMLSLGASCLSGQHLLLSVSAHAAPQCGPAVSSMLDPQGTEARLQTAGFRIAKARNASLVHNVNCVVDKKAVAVEQCLALSEFVAAPSQSRGVQVTTKWRECKVHACIGAACGASVTTGLRELESLFITNFQDHKAAAAAPAPRAPNLPYQPSAAETMTTRVIFYLSYILICITVMFRWQFFKHAR